MRKILSIIIAMAICIGCGKRIDDGEYRVFGYTLTNKAVSENIKVTTVPTFVFTKKHLLVKDDFDFKCFVDLEYKYKIKENKLFLYGATEQRALYIDFDERYIDLVIEDNDYLQKLTLAKIE